MTGTMLIKNIRDVSLDFFLVASYLSATLKGTEKNYDPDRNRSGASELHWHARRGRLILGRPRGLVRRGPQDLGRALCKRGAGDNRLLDPAAPSRVGGGPRRRAQRDRGRLRPGSGPDGRAWDLVGGDARLGQRRGLGGAVDLLRQRHNALVSWTEKK